MPNLAGLTTNFFPTPNEGFITTTSGSIDSSSATTIGLNSVSGLINGSVFTGIIDPGNAKQRAFTGVVDTGGSQITSVVFTTGSSATHTAGATVVDYVTSTHVGQISKGVTQEHKQSGAHKDITADSVTVAGVPLAKTQHNAPQGYLINGKIETSVASNNLTVSIKTMGGATPSATDPVYCRIGNTVRSITSALSVTKNAGTNWFNSGSTDHATQEIDYFVYLGYNTTDGVTIGFARIPYARVYGDFSATSTNDKYCAISIITSATSTDEYEVIGRFNAILSATASFNWSIPGTSIIINRPIFKTRWLTYTPTLTGMTLGNGTLSCKYQIDERTCDGLFSFVFGTTSAVTGDMQANFPISTATYPGTGAVFPIGTNRIFDVSLSQVYDGSINWASSTVFNIRNFNASGTYVLQTVNSSTIPFTWANTDEVAAQYKARLV